MLAPDFPGTLKHPEPLAQEASSGWRWRLNRLRCMDKAEIMHRLKQGLSQRVEALGVLGLTPAPPANLEALPPPWIALDPGPEVKPAPYLAEARRLAEGYMDVFALKHQQLGSPPNWNRDPKTGIEAPLVFGKTLDYRNPALVGDIKYLWEPNRHQHLVTLAQAWRLSGDPEPAQTLARHLESWFAACPPYLGPNWASALEPALRLISWSLSWQLLGGAKSPLFADTAGQTLREAWLESVFRHCDFVAGFFSLHSSANNHLIGEAVGLYLAALTWPCWPQSRIWEQSARQILETEALRQNGQDGVNREQATAYHQYELELLLQAFLAARARGKPFPDNYAQRLEQMLVVLASLMDVGGHLPHFGDADDARAARLDPSPDFHGTRSLLATGAMLFDRSDFKALAGPLDEQNRWLLGLEGAATYEALSDSEQQPPPRRTFPEGGYYILGTDLGSPEEIRLIADAGPLGYLGIAAHGHADALSFTFSVGGTELLVDPGTYAYHTQGEWRRYFRGTSAHNTLRVDGLDQSQQGGNFLWLAKAQAGANLNMGSEQDRFMGWHDGYLRLTDPVLHRREIQVEHDTRRILINDRLEMAGSHLIELFFHFAPNCQVWLEGEFCMARAAGRVLKLHLPQPASAGWEILKGSLAPMGGWYSPAFDCKVPAPTLRWHCQLTGFTHMQTELLVLSD